MKLFFALTLSMGLILGKAFNASAQTSVDQGKILHESNFEKIETGKAPEDFLILDGAFAVREGQGNKYLELPGTPLETYGLLFGPKTAPGNAVSARVFATSKGRRFPAFAVGMNGQAGYKLQVSPAKKVIEIFRGDQVIETLAHEWKSGAWTHLKLWVGDAGGGKVFIKGKVWESSVPEPSQWLISAEDNPTTATGRASVWGTPYSGTPIWFDDFSLTALPSK